MDTAEPIRQVGKWLTVTLTPIYAAVAVVAGVVDEPVLTTVLTVLAGLITIGAGWAGLEKARSVVWAPDSVDEALDEARALAPRDLPVPEDTPIDLEQVVSDAGLA